MMKFRMRLMALASVASGACLLFLFLQPKLSRNDLLDDIENDYVDVADEDSDEEKLKTGIFRSTTTKRSFPFSNEADIFDATAREAQIKKLLDMYGVRWNSEDVPGVDLWGLAAGWVTPSEIHGEDVPELGSILKAMNMRPIISADVGNKGTQLKLTLVLEGGQSVVFKPKWYERDFLIEGKPYDGHDRHNGEIVAYHLNRLLGFRRVPLTVGRVVDLEKEILPVATERLRMTFFSNGSNTCFYGKCLYCKGESNGVCANGTKMEGAVILMLPEKFKFQKYRHPWGRTYKEGRRARWEYDDEHYCADVRKMALYGSGRLILDIIDASVFDYIVGNADRHHFEVFQNETESILIMFDNGKSFGNPFHDEESILAPLKQCRRIRYTTVQRLRQMRRGILSAVLGAIVSRDPVAPLLTGHHFRAMERRLENVVKLIENYVLTDADVLVGGRAR